jgi:hypothetical protein
LGVILAIALVNLEGTSALLPDPTTEDASCCWPDRSWGVVAAIAPTTIVPARQPRA